MKYRKHIRQMMVKPALLSSLLMTFIFLSLFTTSLGVVIAKADQWPDTIELSTGQSQSLVTPWQVKRVSVSDPTIADVQVLEPNQVLLIGKSNGITDLLIWSEKEQMLQSHVYVGSDLVNLSRELNRLFPDADLKLGQLGDTTVIKGYLRRIEHTSHLHSVLDAAKINYVDMTSVAGVQQVMIQVRIAEASRTAIRALGINFYQTGNDLFGASTIGPSNGGPLNPINIGVDEGVAATHNLPFSFLDAVNVSPGVTLFSGIPVADFQIFLQALAENQYMRILAEPNLVALSGEEASFLAGGEFPIPIVQGGSSDGTAITIEYREYGIRLQFTPTVLGDGSIHLHVAPEVSELSSAGGVQIQGFQIPSIVTRRAETTIELHSGQTFAMAGLLSNDISARNSRVPGLGDLPILGPLFRSVRYEKGESELVVLVTANLVEPLSITKAQPLPGSIHETPDDWELFMDGRLESKNTTQQEPPIDSWLRDAGIDQLKGPGAWASYQRPSNSNARKSLPSININQLSSDTASIQNSVTEQENSVTN